jgi:uncharacterized protein YdaU (DUF1376 family)
MGNPPAFQLYSADFYMDTNDWTIEEIGIYTRLLLTEWTNGGLPNDDVRLARIAGCGTKKFQKSWRSISFKFHPNGDGKLINTRMEESREKQAQYIEKQREKGKIRSLEMWKGHIAVAKPTAKERLQPEDSSSSSSSSSPLKKEKNITTFAEYAEAAQSAVALYLKENFEIWRKAYPAIDLETESAKALSWLNANPKNKKSNIKRFLNNWLSRAQERAPRAMQSGPKTMKQIIQEEGL